MDANLFEIISLGNIIQKCYYLDEPVEINNLTLLNLIIEYNQEQLNGSIIDSDTDEIVSAIDLEFFDKPLTFDIDMDKHVLSDFFYNTKITINKECDDYSELYG